MKFKNRIIPRRKGKYYIPLLFLIAVIGCKDPAPECETFCNFRIIYKNGGVTNKQMENFGGTGKPFICGMSVQGITPKFSMFLKGEGLSEKIGDFTGLTCNQKGQTDWFTSDLCISKEDAINYKKKNVHLEINNYESPYFLVKDNTCPVGMCKAYTIGKKTGYEVKKEDCGVELWVQLIPEKRDGDILYLPCSCN